LPWPYTGHVGRTIVIFLASTYESAAGWLAAALRGLKQQAQTHKSSQDECEFHTSVKVLYQPPYDCRSRCPQLIQQIGIILAKKGVFVNSQNNCLADIKYGKILLWNPYRNQ
jgi:hypothetical protein